MFFLVVRTDPIDKPFQFSTAPFNSQPPLPVIPIDDIIPVYRTGYLDVESAIQAARTHIQSYFDSDFSFEDEIQKNWTAEQLSEPNSELLSLSSMSKTQESLL